MKLPELPEPVHHIMSDGACIGYYNETQLLEYGRQCAEQMREACANCYSPDDSATDWADKIRAWR